MAQKLDLLIGASSASIQQLEKDLSGMALKPLQIANITLNGSAIASIQKEIQAAIDGATYTLNLNVGSGATQDPLKTISSKYAETIKDYQNNIMTKNYLGDLGKLNLSTAQIDAFRQKLMDARVEFEKLATTTKGGIGQINYAQAERLSEIYRDVERSFMALKNQGTIDDPLTQSTLDKLQQYKVQLQDISYYEATMRRAGVENTAIDAEIAKLTQLQAQLQNINPSTATETEVRAVIQAIDELLLRIQSVNRQQLAPRVDAAATAEISRVSANISRLYEKFPNMESMEPAAFARLGEIQEQLYSTDNIQSARQLGSEVKSIEAGLLASGSAGEHFGDVLKKRVFSQLGNMALSYFVMALRRAFRELYQAVADVDKAMTELRKVTDLTAGAYSNFLTKAQETAKSLGATVDDYVNATADFARLGYTLQESEVLASTATIYKNVGDGIESISDASESIISTMKAFNIEAKDSMDIVDAFNEVGNNYAISSTGIGEALQNSASALAAANNDLSQSIALVVAGNDVVQNPTKVGTALKTISMFLRAAKAEAEEAGESTEGMADSVSKLRGELLQLTHNKVDIMLDDKTFKSTYDILKELSEVWNDLSDVSQAAITEKIGGKRNANVVTSILNNFKDAEAVIKTIAGDSGSAQKEQEKWLDSIEGRVGQLKASAQSFSMEILDTETVKSFVSLLANILDIVTKISKFSGVFVGFAGLLGGLKIIGNLEGVATVFAKINMGFRQFGANTVSNIASLKSLDASISASSAKMMSNSSEINKNTALKIANAMASKGLIGSEQVEAVAQRLSTNEIKKDSLEKQKNIVLTEGLATSTSGLAAALGVVTMAVSAFAIIYSGINQIHQQNKQRAEEATQSYKDASTSLGEYAEKIKELRKEIDESDSSETRLQKTEELRDIEKKLVEEYGNQAAAIDLINGKLDDEISKVGDLAETKGWDFLGENAEELSRAADEAESGTVAFGNKGHFTHNLSNYASDLVIKNPDDFEKVKKYLQDINVELLEASRIGKIGTFSMKGDVLDRMGYLEQLRDYMIKSGEFEEESITQVEKGYAKLNALVKSNIDLLELGADAWAKYRAAPAEKETYEQFTNQIEKANEAIKNEDWDLASSIYQGLVNSLNQISESDSIPKYVKLILKRLFKKAYTVDIGLKLRVYNEVINDSSLMNDLEGLRDEFGRLNAIKIKKMDGSSWDKLGETAKRNGVSIQTLIDIINEFNDTEIEDKDVNVNVSGTKASMVDKILEAEDGFDRLQKIYNDIKDKGDFDFGNLKKKDFIEDFKITEEAYNEFLETITEYPEDLDKCQDAFNKLTSEYLVQSGVLDDLSEKNKKLLIGFLESKGVTNATAIVNKELGDTLKITESGYKNLCATLGKTVDASIDSTGQYKIEKSALMDLGYSAGDAQRLMAAAQVGMTADSGAGLLARLENYEAEAEAIREIANLQNEMNKSGYGYFDESGAWVLPYEGAAPQGALDMADEYWEAVRDQENQTVKDAQKITAYLERIEKLKANVNTSYSPRETGSSKSGGSKEDAYLKQWKQNVKVQKQLMEQDQLTKAQYYEWLESAYKDPAWSGLAAPGYQKSEYADEIAEIETEIYKWKKEKIQSEIDDEDAMLKNQKANGLITEKEYQKQLAKIRTDGYKKLQKAIEEDRLYGVDTTERLEAETKMLEDIKSATVAAYNEEVADLDHAKALELITAEQYYAQRAALMHEYYADEEMYREELKKEEEELFKLRTDLVKKYADVAKKAISSIMDVGKDLADAIGDLVEGIIDANRSNFDLQKGFLEHQLKMNYITEEQYYADLKHLYTTYFKSKEIYLDEYWENQEEIYQHELDAMENGASALEDIHARVIDMIKQELEDAKDAIEETKDSYNKLIDIRRKALEEEKNENDTERSRVEKLNEIAELTRQLNALRNDNSAEGQRRYKEVFAKLVEAKRELQRFEEEQAYKDAEKQLDKDAEAVEKRAEEQTKALDDKLDDNEWLVNEAWARLRGMNEDLYNELMDYTKKHSTSIKDEVTGSWEAAKNAFEEYKGDVESGYADISKKLAHPELYYRGMTDKEKEDDGETIKRKEFQNYADVLGSFAEDIAGIMGTSAQAVAEILNTMFPGYITDLMVDGADVFASSLGIVGINNSVMSTVAALGGIAGIIEMMNGFQDLAEGNTSNMGIAIGGKNIDSILALLTSIQDYQNAKIGGADITNTLLNTVIGAVAAGPTDGSNVVTGITALGSVMASLLVVGTTLLAGGGTGAATLTSLLQGLGGLLGANNLINAESGDNLVSIIQTLAKVCDYSSKLLFASEGTNSEIGGLRNVMHNSWSLIYNLLQNAFSYSGNMSVISGLVGALAGTVFRGASGTYEKLPTDSASLTSVISDSLIKVLGSTVQLTGGALNKMIDLGAKISPAVTSGCNNTVSVYPTFNIKSTDPTGVANAIEGLMPKIADYTINVMLNSTNNKGVKRSVSSLV